MTAFSFHTSTGRHIDDRVAAGEVLRNYLNRVPNDWTSIGTLGGLELEAQRHIGYETQIRVRIVGDDDTVDWTIAKLWDAAPHTIITRIERHLEALDERLTKVRTDRATAAEQIERARTTIGQPFPHADRLDDLSASTTRTRHRARHDALGWCARSLACRIQILASRWLPTPERATTERVSACSWSQRSDGNSVVIVSPAAHTRLPERFVDRQRGCQRQSPRPARLAR